MIGVVFACLLHYPTRLRLPTIKPVPQRTGDDLKSNGHSSRQHQNRSCSSISALAGIYNPRTQFTATSLPHLPTSTSRNRSNQKKAASSRGRSNLPKEAHSRKRDSLGLDLDRTPELGLEGPSRSKPFKKGLSSIRSSARKASAHQVRECVCFGVLSVLSW